MFRKLSALSYVRRCGNREVQLCVSRPRACTMTSPDRLSAGRKSSSSGGDDVCHRSRGSGTGTTPCESRSACCCCRARLCVTYVCVDDDGDKFFGDVTRAQEAPREPTEVRLPSVLAEAVASANEQRRPGHAVHVSRAQQRARAFPQRAGQEPVHVQTR